jgi:hypothetical protein
MKHLFTLLSILTTLSFSGYSQTLSLTEMDGTPVSFGDTLTIAGLSTESELISHIKVKNDSGSQVTVTCEKLLIQNLPGATYENNVFCWASNCYPPDVNISSNSQPIASMATDSAFTGHLYPGGLSGIAIIKYTFKVYHGDSAWFFAKFVLNATSIMDIQANLMSEPFPNPARETSHITYDLGSNNSGSILLYSITGTLVKEIVLESPKGIAGIPVQDLNEGVYLCVLSSNGKTLRTHRLVVKR